MESRLYFGHVMHQRLKHFRHRLRYRIFTLYLDLDELPQLGEKTKILSYNTWNIFSIYDKDHAKRDGAPMKGWVTAHAKEFGVDLAGGKISVLCFPRLFGYVFNPLSIYFCKDASGKLAGILYEVKNTCGEQHGYFLKTEPKGDAPLEHGHAKEFYVSPFIQMKAEYAFTVREPDDKLSVHIRQHTDGSDLLMALWTGKRADLTFYNLMKSFILFPFQAFHVMWAIHWHALLIWLKGGKYYSRPPLQDRDVT